MARGYTQFLEEHWREVSGEDRTSSKLTPFWPVFVKKDEKGIIDWLMENKGILEEEQGPRAENQLGNIRFYNGMQMLQSDRGIKAIDQDSRPITKNAMFVMNHARDFINQSTNRICSFKPEVKCLPWSNEYTDKLGARFSKRVVDNLFYQHNFTDIYEDIVREGYICGESFLFTLFDPFAGDLDKRFDEIKAMGVNGLKTTEWGEQLFTTETGEEIPLELVKRVGEVVYEQPLPWFVLQEPQFRWKDVNYIYKGRVRHMDEVRAENRGVSFTTGDFSRSNNKSGVYGPGFSYGEYTIEWEFFHRGHRFLDKGAYCKFTEDGTLLKFEDLPYSHRKLPVSRFTNYTDPMSAHGISIFEDLKPPLILYNKLMNLMYRNIAIGAHPKMMVSEGSCNINSLANGPLVVEYQWPQKPELMTFNTIGGEVFSVTDRIMGDASKFSGTFGISRGENMPNARAASILNFYEEQEEKHATSQVKKAGYFIEDVAGKSLGTAGDYYEADDGRTIRILGKNNQYKIRKIDDVTKLSGPYDVRSERTTAMSESPQGRIDQITSLSTIPLAQKGNGAPEAGLFTREQVLRMIQLEDTPTFFEMATAAVERAESENEDLFEGIPVDEPYEWQAHVIDWNVHFQFMQSREFSDTQGVPEEVREAFLDHMRVHEQFMYKKAQGSLAMAQELSTNTYFPAVFKIGPSNPSIAQLVIIHQTPPMPPEGALPPAPEEEAAQAPNSARESVP